MLNIIRIYLLYVNFFLNFGKFFNATENYMFSFLNALGMLLLLWYRVTRRIVASKMVKKIVSWFFFLTYTSNSY